MHDRRQRIHELVLALLARLDDLELLDGDDVLGRGGSGASGADPAGWLERNRRLVHRYQALVRSAVTLDALIDQEVSGKNLSDRG
jgi:hypothetical protein